MSAIGVGSDADSGSLPPDGTQVRSLVNANGNAHSLSSWQNRHEPRGRKPNDHLPPSRAREVQRAFRLRRAEHLASLEERIAYLESENGQLRALLALPEAERPKIGSGPTGRGKSLKEGGVPMSERVRARKEARERERRAKGLPDLDSSEDDELHHRDSATLSPRAVSGSQAPLSSGSNTALPALYPNQQVEDNTNQTFNFNIRTTYSNPRPQRRQDSEACSITFSMHRPLLPLQINR
jgi:hypothetical protein